MKTSQNVCGFWLRVTLLLIATFVPALGQFAGAPPPPPAPYDAMVFYPLESPPWADFYGDPAKGFTNLNVVSSWDYPGAAVSLDTNCGPYLQYDVYQDGYTNVMFDSGSISFWFQANWTSLTDGGTGPTNWAALFSVGNWTSNAQDSAWTIAISPEGTNLVIPNPISGDGVLPQAGLSTTNTLSLKRATA